jgi:hypothetical protein
MRKGLILLGLLFLWTANPARAELNIGINLSFFPQMEMVPGYPVYYAPDIESNYFFYDGAYWVYQDDNWYSSYWYNGPWEYMDPEYVPLFVLRIPVRYYRRPPMYFRGWQSDAPPRWGDHWGSNWSQRRSGWDQWDRRRAPAPAPLPTYQRQYSGNRYPPVSQQRELQSRNYNYRPTEERHAGHDRPPQAPTQSPRDTAHSPSATSRPQQEQQRQNQQRRDQQKQDQQKQDQQRRDQQKQDQQKQDQQKQKQNQQRQQDQQKQNLQKQNQQKQDQQRQQEQNQQKQNQQKQDQQQQQQQQQQRQQGSQQRQNQQRADQQKQDQQKQEQRQRTTKSKQDKAHDQGDKRGDKHEDNPR